MKIYLNNRPQLMPDGVTLEKVLGPRELPKIAAVWVNGEPILSDNYATYQVQPEDRIKISRITGEYDIVYLRYGKKHFGMRHE